ncbi:MAG: cytidylate kinase family protein [Desulfobacterales bacterium]|nr:cytidylate kinase family protein [Desulfobacterales bacterium]
MSLITISQSMGSADPDIAKIVANKLNLELFDDQRLRDRAMQLEIKSEDLKGLDEKAPGFFDRFLSSKPESYLEYMESVIYEVAKEGQGVIMGHGSQILLRDFGCALHVLIHASEPYRIEQLGKKQGLGPEVARKLILKSDNEKKGFFKFAFNLNWDDPSLYDLMINSGKLGSEAAASLIIATARLDEIKTCSLTALETMEKLSQERAVRAVLLKHNVNLTLLHLEVPQKGTLALRGFAYSEEDKERVIKLVKSVPGIASVTPEISILEYMDV